jgi:phospholipase C
VELIGQDSSLSAGSPCFNFAALPNLLAQNGLTWNYYADATKENFVHNGLDAIRSVRYNTSLWAHVVPFSQFTTDALNGTLPNVSWVLGDNLEHPPETACDGENETVGFVNAVMQGPDWGSTAIFVYWDEWGGFYDHVPPPQINSVSYGVRVPLLIISPWTKYGASLDGGSISSTLYSQASTLKFIETNWNLPSLNQGDGGANDMMDLFDFSQTPKDPLILNTRSCPALSAAERKLLASRDPD